MDDKKISQLTEAFYNTVNGEWEFILADGTNSTNYRFSVDEMRKFVLGVLTGGIVRPIGTNSDGAVVTTDGVQDLENKNLSKSMINGVQISDAVTGAHINLLSGLSVNVNTALQGLHTRVSSVENQGNTQAQILAVRYCFDDVFSTSALTTSKSYSVSDILEKLGLSGYSIPYSKCQIQIWQQGISNSREFSLVPPVAGKTIISADAGGTNVSIVRFENLNPSTTYNVSISFNVTA